MKPTITARERKLARKASRKYQNTKNNPPHIRANAPAYWTRSGSPGAAKAIKAAPTNAAIEASGLPTTWREAVNRAQTNNGMMAEYKPTTGGKPATWAKPIFSGMISAAKVTPAVASRGTSAQPIPRIPTNGWGQRVVRVCSMSLVPRIVVQHSVSLFCNSRSQSQVTSTGFRTGMRWYLSAGYPITHVPCGIYPSGSPSSSIRGG